MGEYRKVLGKDDEDAKEQGNHGTPEPEGSSEVQRRVSHLLCPSCPDEMDMADQDSHPRKQAKARR